LLILFQAEIRQVLEKVSFLKYLRPKREFSRLQIIEETVRAAFELADDRIGAIIVLTREDDPAEFLNQGQPVMAVPTAALYKSIFNPHAPAHDGAVVVAGDRLMEMGAFLPLTERDDVPKEYGSRHRAAVGLSERTDAVCLVVSEERGRVSGVVGGEITLWESAEELTHQLKDWLGVLDVPGPSVRSFIRVLFVENWGAKIGSLVLVSIAWLVLAGAQTITMNIRVPVEFYNLPDNLTLDGPAVGPVRLEVSGPRRQLIDLEPRLVRLRVNLAGLGPGTHPVRLLAKDVTVPLGLTIQGVWPHNIRVTLTRPAKSGPEQQSGPTGKRNAR
jgi:hypothetical protein